jgi:RNA polymerase sigma-70 factor, ECF subfamily
MLGQPFTRSVSPRPAIEIQGMGIMISKASTSESERPSVDRERDLMNRARSGDVAAYGKIFELHQERIYRMAYAMLHDSGAAEDCVQETFASGLANLTGYRGESAPKAWFTAIALNLCRHRVRDWKYTPASAADHALESGRRTGRPRTRGVLSRVAQQEDRRLLAIALGFLTEAQREVFILHYDQDLSYEEIGDILRIRPGAARGLAHRAKAMLREKLGSELLLPKDA